jgi:transposase
VHPSPKSNHALRSPTEVTTKATRRTFTNEFKKRILEEVASCDHPGERGAILRREGLYSSHLTQWRRERDEGRLAGPAPKKRGPKAKPHDPTAAKLAAVERENARLKAENAKLQLICDVQKKVSSLLGLTLPTVPDDDESGGSSL